MNKNTRQIVFNKCEGRCAYCGIKLGEQWDIDHILPKVDGGTDEIKNLNPSCKECNRYKCHMNLESYRRQLAVLLNEKPEYLFKSRTKMQVAINMGSIAHTIWDGKFYFEKSL